MPAPDQNLDQLDTVADHERRISQLEVDASGDPVPDFFHQIGAPGEPGLGAFFAIDGFFGYYLDDWGTVHLYGGGSITPPAAADCPALIFQLPELYRPQQAFSVFAGSPASYFNLSFMCPQSTESAIPLFGADWGRLDIILAPNTIGQNYPADQGTAGAGFEPSPHTTYREGDVVWVGDTDGTGSLDFNLGAIHFLAAALA